MKKIVTILLSCLVIACAVGYGVGVWYFQDHFLPGQTIQGVNVGFLNTEQAQHEIDTVMATQPVTIETVDQSVTASYEQLGVSIDSAGLVAQAATEQEPWAWPLEIAHASVATDENYQVAADKVNEALLSLGITNPEGKVATQNAEITQNETQFVVTPEVVGTELDAEKAATLTLEQLKAGKTTVSLVEAQVKPTVVGADLQPAVDQANQKLQAIPTLVIREETVQLPSSLLFDAVTIDETLTVSVNEALISDYINGLANDYTVMGSAGTLNTSTMQKTGGMNGSTIDVQPTVAAVMAAIDSGESQQVQATLKEITSPTQIAGVGDTYVQISIADQHLWYYKDGKLVLESDVITGDETQGWGTITGVYSIQALQRDAVLEGYSYGWDYSVPVKYWMPIYSDGTGIHDASWHSSFGGDKYLGGGSHGCINLPPAVAEQLFNTVSVGTPVVLYK